MDQCAMLGTHISTHFTFLLLLVEATLRYRFVFYFHTRICLTANLFAKISLWYLCLFAPIYAYLSIHICMRGRQVAAGLWLHHFVSHTLPWDCSRHLQLTLDLARNNTVLDIESHLLLALLHYVWYLAHSNKYSMFICHYHQSVYFNKFYEVYLKAQF